MNQTLSLTKLFILLFVLDLVWAGKLQPKQAQVSFYDKSSNLIKSEFEYYVQGNKVQYGVRFGVDIFQVALLYRDS